MARVFICPECGHEDDHVEARWDETCFNKCFGTYDPSSGHDMYDTDCNDSECDNYCYYCPECEYEFDDADDQFFVKDSDDYFQYKNDMQPAVTVPGGQNE